MKLRDDFASKILGLATNSGRTITTVTARDSSRLSLGRASRIAIPMVRIKDGNRALVDSRTSGHSAYSGYSDSEAIAAVQGLVQLALKGTTLIVDADGNELAHIAEVLFGAGSDAYPLIHVADISGAASPNYLEQVHAVGQKGNYLLACSRGSDDSLTAWEMQETMVSSLHGSIRGQGSPNYLNDGVVLYVDGDYAYVAAYLDNALSIFDISDPTKPVHTGSAVGAGGTNGHYLDGISSVFVLNGVAYCTSFNDDALSCYDVSDPDDPDYPKLLGYISGAGSPNYLDGASSVWVWDQSGTLYAAVASRLDGSLGIYDVTNPASISLKCVKHHKELGSVDAYELAGALCVQVDGSYAYVATRWQDAQSGNAYYDTGTRVGSVTIFDVSSPAAIVHKGEVHGAGSPNYLSEAHWLHKLGDYCYVAAFADNCLTIINVADPTNPYYCSHIGGEGSPNYCNGVTSVYVEQRDSRLFAYLSAYWDNAMVIFDVTDYPTMYRIGGRTGTGDPYRLSRVHSVFVKDNRAYCCSRGDDDALTIWGVEPGVLFKTSNPIGRIAGSSNYLDGASGLAISSNYAYVASYNSNALVKIDITSLTAMSKVGQASGSGSPNYLSGAVNVFVSGSYAYVTAVSDHAFTIWDISGSTPSQVGILLGSGSPNYLGGARGLYVDEANNRAYVTGQTDDSLVVIDISTKSSPALVNQVHGAGSPNYLDGAIAVWVDDGFAYVLSRSEDSLTIWDVSAVDSSNPPQKAWSIVGAGSPYYLDEAYALCKDGDDVYIAAYGDDALMLYDAATPGSPFRKGELRGASNPNFLNGATAVAVVTLFDSKFVVVAAHNDNALSVNKVSDFAIKNRVGIRNNAGKMQYRNAFGSWTDFV